MFTPDRTGALELIVLTMLEELDAKLPGLAERVEARINSTAKGADGAFLADLQEAGRLVATVTT